jgi:hypothetical protein
MSPSTYAASGYQVARGLLTPHDIASIRDTFMDMNRAGSVKRLSEIPRRFDGTIVKIPEAIDGGPCGTLQISVLH